MKLISKVYSQSELRTECTVKKWHTLKEICKTARLQKVNHDTPRKGCNMKTQLKAIKTISEDRLVLAVRQGFKNWVLGFASGFAGSVSPRVSKCP